jgi:hypothetical protein
VASIRPSVSFRSGATPPAVSTRRRRWSTRVEHRRLKFKYGDRGGSTFQHDPRGNTANEAFALFNNTTGVSNTAVGYHALLHNTTSSLNTAIGVAALSEVSTGSDNIGLGAAAGFNVTTASNVICIGSTGANVSGACYISNIRGVQTQNANAIPVLIDTAGQLGTQSSSRRFKEEIKSMESSSEAILALRPVTFEYKSDETNTPQFGLIAEEVAEINPDLVVRDENGEIYTVRYDAVNAMLLNESLKEHYKGKTGALVSKAGSDYCATAKRFRGNDWQTSSYGRAAAEGNGGYGSTFERASRANSEGKRAT